MRHPQRALQDLARWCWAQDPHERPTFAQVTKFLCLLLEEEESERATGPIGMYPGVYH